MRIPYPTQPGHIAIALDTLQMRKQALMFLNTRKGAEKAAEDLARAAKKEGLAREQIELAERIRTVLSPPTKQCERLAQCVKEGMAFHHSGLASTQRSLIENAFRAGTISIICCTPTLAAGVDLPSFRTIIRDVKRYGNYGMDYIPVLEYLQMAGRSGRPSYDSYGECILIAGSPHDKETLIERYINGEPEDVTSKLAAEPALRTHILALIAQGAVQTHTELMDFMRDTYYAYHYKDMHRLEIIIGKITTFLRSNAFIEGDEFMSANGEQDLRATPLGMRISQLYLDPYSASILIDGMKKARTKDAPIVGYIDLLTQMLELRPYPSIRKADHEMIAAFHAHHHASFLREERHDDLSTLKLTLIILDWLDENDEKHLTDTYSITPGDLHAKLTILDWLCYSASDIAPLINAPEQRTKFQKLRLLIKYGIKSELLELVRIKNIGRARARTLYRAGIRTHADIITAPQAKLASIIGEKLAAQLKTMSPKRYDATL